MATIVKKRLVVVRTTFDAVHQWVNAPIDTQSISSILQYPHRHKFYVELRAPVTHSDRQIEFLEMKAQLDKICHELFSGSWSTPVAVLPYSCETIAAMIGECLTASDRRFYELPMFTVSVFEDNENGAEVTFE